MALSSLTVEARGLDDIPYRIDVNGGGTIVTANGQFFVVDRGESEDRGLNPIWPSKARIFMRDVDVSPLFGEPDREVPVEAFDITGSADTLVFSGYMVTDFFGDAPFSPANIVELQALDGLGTLENDPIDDLYTGDSFVSYQTAIVEILRGLAPLGVEIGAHWYPARSSIAASDNPLESGGFTPNNYREDRPEGDYLNQLSLLRDLLKGTGATVQQVDRRAESADARWHVRQRDALNEDGTIKAWVYTAATDSPNPTTLDRSRSLSVSDLLRDHGRDFVRRRQTVQVTHDFISLQNLIPDPGFEEQGETGTSPWTLAEDGGTNFNVKLHDNLDTPRQSTSDNKYAISVFKETTERTSSPDYPASAPIEGISGAPTGTVGEFQVRSKSPFRYERVPDNIEQEGLAVEFEYAGSYLTAFTTEVQENAESFDEQVVVKSTDRRIPRGARLPIQPAYEPADDGADLSVQGTITLTQPAPKGTTVLVGNIQGTDPNSGEVVRYAGMSETKQPLRIDRWKRDSRRYGAFPIRFPWTDENGNPLTGNGTIMAGGQNLRFSSEPAFGFYDDFRLRLLRDGDVFDQITVQATVPELGETEEQTLRTSSGPTTQNLARMHGNDPNGIGFEPTQWDVKKKVFNGTPEVDSDTAAGSTSVPVSTGYRENLDLKPGQGVGFEGQEERYLLDSGLAIGEFTTGTLDLKRGLESALSAGDEVQLGSVSLAKLKAQQRLRYWQNHNEKLTVTAYQRHGGLPLTGDELVTLDGTEYTVHSVEYDAAQGESRATLIKWNNYQ